MAYRYSRMSPAERELVQQCFEAPDDNARRWDYVRSLSDSGQAAHAELASTQMQISDPEVRHPISVEDHEIMLLYDGDTLRSEWLDDWPELPDVQVTRDRGLAEDLLVGAGYDGDPWLAAYLREFPLLKVHIALGPHADCVLDWSPANVFGPPASFFVQGETRDWDPNAMGPELAAAFTRATHLSALRHLGFISFPEWRDCVPLDAPALAGAERLTISQCRLTNAVLAALAGAPRLRPLRELCLSNNMLTDDAIDVLVGWAALAGLRELDLSGNRFSAAAAEGLDDASFCDSLERLSMRGTGADAAEQVLRRRFRDVRFGSSAPT